jgi:hypothetical protein
MSNSYLLQTLGGTAARNGLQIATLIGDLSRSLDILSADIEHEEERAGVRDVSDPYLSIAGAEPEDAKGEHWGDHCFAGAVGPTDTQGGLSRLQGATAGPSQSSQLHHIRRCPLTVERRHQSVSRPCLLLLALEGRHHGRQREVKRLTKHEISFAFRFVAGAREQAGFRQR